MKALTAWQANVLEHIERAEVPLTVSEIVAVKDASPSSVRYVLKVLERYGYVERRGVALSGGATWGPIGGAA